MKDTNECRTEYPLCPRAAVGAVVFKNERVLLVNRGKAPSKGLWAIPGGSVNLGETLQVAAEREIFEETGITIKAGKPIYTFDFIDRDPAGRVRFHYVIVDLAAEYQCGSIAPADDALEARWVSSAEIKMLDVNERTRTLLMTAYGFGG